MRYDHVHSRPTEMDFAFDSEFKADVAIDASANRAWPKPGAAIEGRPAIAGCAAANRESHFLSMKLSCRADISPGRKRGGKHGLTGDLIRWTYTVNGQACRSAATAMGVVSGAMRGELEV